MFDVIVIGAGPAGVVAALRAADLGANTALITRDEFGGMAANDGPIPVRTLAHAARLIREARQLGLYGITVSEPVLDYPRLLARVRGLERAELPRALECCGFGGTFSLKNADTSTAMLDDKCASIEESGAAYCTALDGSCLLQIGGGLSRRASAVKPIHLAEILAST